jgi:hypothetical protein
MAAWVTEPRRARDMSFGLLLEELSLDMVGEVGDLVDLGPS